MPIKEINTEDDLNQYTSKIRKEVSELHIPIMIKRIENHLVNPLVYKKQILSINKGRNCLVHRNGIVSEKDINNKEEDVLKIEWIRLGFFYENG
ncbi:TPA: hypothetical protein DEP21_02535 [Patescibacteria group bacterium]|nr:hypothetical protein [Candidatus Gracilibacteria bacterium]